MLKSILNGSAEKKYGYSDSCMFYLGAIVVTLVCQALAGVFAAALGNVYPNIAENGDFNTAFMIVVQLFSALFIVLYTKLKKRSFDFVYVNEGTNGERVSWMVFVIPVVAAVVLMAGMYLPTVWYGYFTRYALHIPPEAGQIELTTPSSVVMIVIASVFLAPVCEETVYRGVLFNGLVKEHKAVPAVMLSALAFMLMHMSPVQVVFQFTLGVVGAFIMLASGRLISCIILHAAANALALVMELTPFGTALGGCVEWLDDRVVAALFITLALFAAAFAILFALIKFGFGKHRKKDMEQIANGAEQTDDDKVLTDLRKKDGLFKYIVGVTICAVMFILNTVVSIV